jgi:hypothetical protein
VERTPSVHAPVATIDQVFVATLLGGPLAGYYLAAHNYRALGRGHRFTSTIIGGAFGTLVVVAIATIWPLSFLHLAAVVIAAFLVRNSVEASQRRDLNQHLSNHLPLRSSLNVVGIGVLGFGLTSILWFLAALVITFLQAPAGSA